MNVWLCIPTAEGGGSIPEWKKIGIKILAMCPEPVNEADLFVKCSHQDYKGHPWGIHTLFTKAFNELSADLCFIGQDDNWPACNLETYVGEYVKQFPNLDGVMEPSGGKTERERNLVISGLVGVNFFKQYNQGRGVYDLSYHHFYADQELALGAQKHGKLYRNENIKFLHRHWTKQKRQRPWYMNRWRDLAPKDEENFNQRKKNNFEVIKWATKQCSKTSG